MFFLLLFFFCWAVLLLLLLLFGGLSAAAGDDATWRNAHRSRVAERSPLRAQRSPPQTPVPCTQPGPIRVSLPLPGRMKMPLQKLHQFSNSDEILSIHWGYQAERKDLAFFFFFFHTVPDSCLVQRVLIRVRMVVLRAAEVGMRCIGRRWMLEFQKEK